MIIVYYLTWVLLGYVLAPLFKAKYAVNINDGWIGYYYDCKKKIVYFFLIPYIGVCWFLK